MGGESSYVLLSAESPETAIVIVTESQPWDSYTDSGIVYIHVYSKRITTMDTDPQIDLGHSNNSKSATRRL